MRVVSCYEAGRDGFWAYRFLVSEGVENRVVDSSSIEVNRWKRRAKTDRMDAGKLVEMLRRYEGGEKRVWSVVRVPSAEEEDGRQLSREWEALNRERTMPRRRILSLLIQQGIDETNPSRNTLLFFSIAQPLAKPTIQQQTPITGKFFGNSFVINPGYNDASAFRISPRCTPKWRR